MSQYTISMDYNEFKRLEKSKQDLQILKSRLLNCIDQRNKPYMINIKQLKEIAKEQLSFIPDEGDIFIDV